MPRARASEQWRTRLRLAVARSGKKHSVIAFEAGMDPATLSRVLTGAHYHARLETVVKIAHAAGETVGWVLNEPGFRPSAEQRRRLRSAAMAILDLTSDE